MCVQWVLWSSPATKTVEVVESLSKGAMPSVLRNRQRRLTRLLRRYQSEPWVVVQVCRAVTCWKGVGVAIIPASSFPDPKITAKAAAEDYAKQHCDAIIWLIDNTASVKLDKVSKSIVPFVQLTIVPQVFLVDGDRQE